MLNNQKGSSKTDTMVKLGLVFFIALLSFSIGAFVGKKFSDNQHKLAKYEPAHGEEHGDAHGDSKREVASVPEGHGDVKPESHLSDEEIAKLAKEFVSEDEALGVKHEATHAEVKAHDEHPTKVAVHVAKTADGHGAVAAAKADHDSKSPPETKKAADARIPSSLPQVVAPTANGKFTVQVASYSDEAEAQKFAGELKNKGYSAFYIPAKVRGQNWYRVNVGMFPTQDEAQQYRAKLMTEAKVSAAIIQKIVN